ncbi:MAG: ABC transporter substrate-binding protein [Methanothrix sp.]|nr:ABC transporter substrate-binding protein [Methanothrix sp.]
MRLLSIFIMMMLLSYALPVACAYAPDYTLEIFGNANMDGNIDQKDIDYVEGVINGINPATNLSDANYDGKIDTLDVYQIKKIMNRNETELTIIDSRDRIVTVQIPVKRIAVLTGWTLEVMRSLKLERDRIVGVDQYVTGDKDWKTFFPEFSDYPNCGSSWTPNYEEILKCNPDVVFISTSSSGDCDTIPDRLKELDTSIKVIRFDSTDPLHYADEARKLGYILGKENDAEKFIDYYDGLVNEITEKIKEIPEDKWPKVYLEYYSPYTTFGGGTGSSNIVEMAGGRNIFSDLSNYPEVDPEEVMTRNPEIILRMAGSTKGQGGYAVDNTTAMKNISEEIMSRPELATVSAVENDRVYLSINYFFGARHFIGMGYMAKWFYPDLFNEIDPKAIHQEYLKKFQGLDLDLDKHGSFVYHPKENPEGK